MRTRTLEEAVRSLFSEQKYNPLKQWEKEKKPEIDVGGHPHELTSPNKSHIEEEDQIDEIMGTATSLGGRHNPRQNIAKKSLGGKRYQRRSALHRSGNQRRSPAVYEEVREKFMKKLSEKKSEKALGKTATGQPGETIDTEPNKPDMTGHQ